MIAAGDLDGHWRRDWIRARGTEDRTTQVDWLQGPRGYVDLRIRADQPDLRDAVPADLAASELAALMQSEGFAGTIGVTSAVCTWTRDINWHGRPDAPDVGQLAWQGAHLIETGVHADYAEQWSRADPTPPQRRVFACGAWRLHLVWTDDAFLLGIADPDAPSTAALKAALGQGERPSSALAAQFRSLFARGAWEGGTAVILAATAPMLVGRSLFNRRDVEAGHLTTTRPDFHGKTLTEAWKA